MKNKTLTQALACLSLLACQQLMAKDMVRPATVIQPGNGLEDSLAMLSAKEKTTADVPASKGQQNLILSALLSDGLAGSRYEGHALNVQTFGNLSYTASKKINIPVPNSAYSLEADFGFAGSGEHELELIMPFPTVRVHLACDENALAPLTRFPETAQELGEIVLRNELNKFGQGTNSDALIKSFGFDPYLKPRQVFLFKLGLLIDHTVRTQDVSFFTQEVSRLVLRLALSDDFFLKDVKPSSLVPQVFATSIAGVIPDLLPVLDGVFNRTKELLKTTKVEALDRVKTFAFVFSNNKEAAKAFEAYAKTVINKPESLAMLRHYLGAALHLQILDDEEEEDREKFLQLCRDNDGLVKQPQDNIVAQFIAFGEGADELVEAQVLDKANAARVAAKAGLVTPLSAGTIDVVCFSTDKADFDQLETFGSIAQAVASAWNEYQRIVQTEKEKGLAVEAGELLIANEADRRTLKDFFTTDAGISLQARLQKALDTAHNPFEKTRMQRNNLLEELNAIELELAAEKGKLAEETTLLNKRRTAAGKLSIQVSEAYPEQYVARPGQEKLVARFQSGIATSFAKMQAAEAKINELEARIKQLNVTIESLNAQLSTVPMGTKFAEMESLVRAMAAGNGNDADLQRRLQALQQEIKADADKAETAKAKLTIEEKIELRGLVLHVYQEELKLIEQELVELKGDPVRKARLDVYRKFLKAQVDRRVVQQDGLARLVQYKQALTQVSTLAEDDMADYLELERNLGFILRSNDVQEIYRVTKPKLSLVEHFKQELANPTSGSAFEPMHAAFVDTIATIIARSTAAGENTDLTKSLLAMFLPTAYHQILGKIIAKTVDAR